MKTDNKETAESTEMAEVEKSISETKDLWSRGSY